MYVFHLIPTTFSLGIVYIYTIIIIITIIIYTDHKYGIRYLVKSSSLSTSIT